MKPLIAWTGGIVALYVLTLVGLLGLMALSPRFNEWVSRIFRHAQGPEMNLPNNLTSVESHQVAQDYVQGPSGWVNVSTVENKIGEVMRKHIEQVPFETFVWRTGGQRVAGTGKVYHASYTNRELALAGHSYIVGAWREGKLLRGEEVSGVLGEEREPRFYVVR